MVKAKMSPMLEFKRRDDAWFHVSLHLQGSHLKVHYEWFQEDNFVMLSPEDFRTAEDLRCRFRMASKQFQDHHCGQLKKTMGICASSASGRNDERFFDAIVEEVFRFQHHLVDGKDRCTCFLKVFWLAGPNANKTTIVYCYNIRLLTPGSIETHPVINDFVKLVEEKMNMNHLERERKIARNKGVDSIGKKVNPATIQAHKKLDNVIGSTSVSELPNELGTRSAEAGFSHSWTMFKYPGLHPLSTTSVNKGIDSIGNKVNHLDSIGKKVNPETTQALKELENVVGSTSVSELPNELGTRSAEAGFSDSRTRFKYPGLHPLSATSVNKGIDSIGHKVNHLDSIGKELENVGKCCNPLERKRKRARNTGVDSIGKKVNPATTQAYKELENVVGSSSVSELPNELGIRCAEPGFSHSWSRFKSHVIHPFPTTSVNTGIDSIGNKVNLATSQACKELDNIDSITNRVNLVTIQTCKELDNTSPGGNGSPTPIQACKGPNIIAGFTESVRPSADGYHESQERCDNIIKESSQCDPEEGADFYASHILVLENLEKDISSSDVIMIISVMTSLVVQVLILPCTRSQGFRRGFVWFKDQASLLRVYTLLQDDNFFIVSSKGRPWVVSITEENGDDGRSKSILRDMTVKSQSQEPKASSGTLGAKKILFVRKGTTEYVKAKQKKERFLEYREQVGLLHRKADYEERTLQQNCENIA